uniref:Alpha-macroglobulin n=1 Tax=Macrostomum lignano TaxID=282301 RepID=A0A1I8HNJ2_9PLAT
YVLPKLQLRLTLPDFVHENDANFTVSAEPRYTYDKIAEGEVSVNVTLMHNCQSSGRHYRYGPCNTTLIGRRLSQSSAGSNLAEFFFSLDEWRSKLAQQGATRARWGDVSALVSGEFRREILRKRYRLTIDTGDAPFILPGMTVPIMATCPGLSNKVFASLKSFQTRGQSAVRVETTQDENGGNLRITVHGGDGIPARNIFCAVVNHEGILSYWLPLKSFGSSEEAADGLAGSIVLTAAQVAAMAPSFTLVGVGFHGNEMVAAAKIFKLAGTYDGLVLTSNVTGPAAPQQPLLVQVRTSPDSFVFLTGIDHSSEQPLLKAAMKRSMLDDGENSRNTDAELQKSGLLALTDFNYVKDQPMMYFMRANMALADDAVMEMAPMAVGAAKKSMPAKPSKPAVSRDGSEKSKQKLTASRSPLNIVSRRSFFIRPVLPYAIVRGEKFLLKVLLFNYGQANLSVSVTLTNDSSLHLLGSEGFTRNSTVPAGSSSLVVFPVEPIRLPAMRLALQAVSLVPIDNIGDSVVRLVRVEAEGATQRRVATALLNLTAGAAASARLAVNFPTNLRWIGGKRLVNDSEYARVQVTGTVLGASVTNLERLLRMPYGCGEQNMINFAPAVFVLDCLGPREATPDTVAKAVRIMKTGYQRELTYRRTDGSYSAFGNNDPAGSTWLTAFVLSIYAQAAAFIPMDPQALAGPSLDFLLSKQQPDGSFAEAGRVIHADMQGAGASGAAGLTAYVCASLVRVIRSCRRHPDLSCSQQAVGPHSRLASALRSGLRFVYDDYRARPADFRPSDLAVAAYAARLAIDDDLDGAGGPEGAKLASFLWLHLYEASRALDGGIKRYWPGGGDADGSVETTGYALLTALARADFQTAAPALRWLSGRQGDLGGFHSTQDTVVGLQAMAQFARSHPGGDGVGSVTVTWPGQPEPLRFGLGPANRSLLQQREIGRGQAARALDGEVFVSGTGSGVALVTVAYAYNLLDSPVGWIAADWTRRGGVGLRLADNWPLGGFAPADGSSVEVAVCATANNGPGMYIVSLSHPSGFAVDEHTPVGGSVARVESESDELVFYLSELTSEICLSVRWVREIPVMRLSPQRITAKNYYKPDQQISLFHLHPKLKDLTECQVCPDCPQCHKPTNVEI